MNSYLMKKIRSIFVFLETRYKEQQFLHQCVTGTGLEIGSTAMCLNSGPKENIHIGINVTIYGTLETQGNGRIEIGDYSNIRYNTYIGSAKSIKIGKYVIISHDVKIYDNNNHPISANLRQELSVNRFEASLNSWTRSEAADIIIEDNVWIGFGAVILKGVRVGKGSIVGACGVVTKDIPPFCVAAGNPAKIVKTLNNDLL